MREGTPSGTSFIVSFARGVGVGDRKLDPLAERWLPRWMGRVAAASTKKGRSGRWIRSAIRVSSLGLVDHMALRTEVIDAKLVEAVGTGISQVVILGAGLDARAWRMGALAAATVYEVDHPSTQEFKRARVAGFPAPVSVRYVPVDFERARFSDALLDAGFEPRKRSVWISEGVAMYLPTESVRDGLMQLASLAAPGSQLLMTYRVPDLLPFGHFGRIAIPLAFRMGGEPLRAAFAPDELEAMLGGDWGVLYDESADGWLRVARSSAHAARSFRSERLVVARRRG